MSDGPRLGSLAAGVIGGVALLLAVVGAPLSRHPAPRPEPAPAPPPSVSADGVTLASASVELPGDDAAFPAGPNADLVTARCTACHSASMVLSQPPLSPDQWQAEVKKMREVYRAPVPDGDVSAILAYLNALTAAHGRPATAKAQDPAPRAKPRVS